jgi:hypothetical protein
VQKREKDLNNALRFQGFGCQTSGAKFNVGLEGQQLG